MIIIVIGMHRSGTSALAGLLHNNGIVIGEKGRFKPESNKENPKGFFENYSFRKINDKILEKCTYRVKSWSTNIPNISAGIIDKFRIRLILKNYNAKYANWGWKDPRTCLTLRI